MEQGRLTPDSKLHLNGKSELRDSRANTLI
jgi:hypothetical protein